VRIGIYVLDSGFHLVLRWVKLGWAGLGWVGKMGEKGRERGQVARPSMVRCGGQR